MDKALIPFLLIFVLLVSCTGTADRTVPPDTGEAAAPIEEAVATEPTEPTQETDVPTAPSGSIESTAEEAEEVKTFVLMGENFKFMMNEQEAPDLVVQEGDTVRIEFTSVGGFHDWSVDEFNARTEKVQTDQSASVEFVANQKGTFEYYCSVDKHRENGMKGKLIVE